MSPSATIISSRASGNFYYCCGRWFFLFLMAAVFHVDPVTAGGKFISPPPRPPKPPKPPLPPSPPSPFPPPSMFQLPCCTMRMYNSFLQLIIDYLIITKFNYGISNPKACLLIAVFQEDMSFDPQILHHLRLLWLKFSISTGTLCCPSPPPRGCTRCCHSAKRFGCTST